METVKISDAGSHYVLSAADEQMLADALEKLIVNGAAIVSPPAKLGTKWLASCTKPKSEGPELKRLMAQFFATETLSGDSGGVTRKTEQRPVTVADAGSHLVISGSSRVGVQAGLDELVQKGSRVISSISQVGDMWVATCEHPQIAVSACKVEEFGLKRVITGPTKEAVAAKVEELIKLDAVLIGEIEFDGTSWTAVCDTGGPQSHVHKW